MNERNENDVQHEELEEVQAIDDGHDHVHDDENHGNEGEQPPNDELPTVELRRSTRVHKPITRYSSSEYVMLTNNGEPESYEEA